MFDGYNSFSKFLSQARYSFLKSNPDMWFPVNKDDILRIDIF